MEQPPHPVLCVRCCRCCWSPRTAPARRKSLQHLGDHPLARLGVLRQGELPFLEPPLPDRPAGGFFVVVVVVMIVVVGYGVDHASEVDKPDSFVEPGAHGLWGRGGIACYRMFRLRQAIVSFRVRVLCCAS